MFVVRLELFSFLLFLKISHYTSSLHNKGLTKEYLTHVLVSNANSLVMSLPAIEFASMTINSNELKTTLVCDIYIWRYL